MANLNEGINTFKLRSKSASGVWNSSQSFTINYDATPPTINGVTIEPSIGNLAIKSSHSSFIVKIAGIIDNLSGVKSTSFYYSRDGVIYKLVEEVSGVVNEYTVENIDINPGRVYIKVVAEDNAGNKSERIVSYPVTYDGPFDYSGHIEHWSNLTGQNR
jgi:hypothetical protein